MARTPLFGLFALFAVSCGSGTVGYTAASPSANPPASATPPAPTSGPAPVAPPAATSSPAAPSLGSAASFSVLGAQTVTNTGPTALAGDLGVSPGSAITGFPPGLVLGTTHAADTAAANAQSDTTSAYDLLSGAPCTVDLTGQDLAGKTLVEGVYCFTSDALLTGNLTLDAQNHADAVFIFKISSKLTAATGSSVLLVNGGSACDVFWKVGSSATIGTSSSFLGNIVALTSIALQTGARLSGRALARNGSVTLDDNQVSGCAVGATDGGVLDAGTPDAGPADAGTPDAGPADAGSAPDGGAGIDAGHGGGLDAGNGGGVAAVTQCKGVCTDLDLDANNCGACGARCSSSQVCRGGACARCPSKDTQCKDQCADLMADNANCGACGKVCTGKNGTCVGGVCSPCDGAVCGNACVWLDKDHANCGACGNACGADQCCVNSQCTPRSSTSGGSCTRH